MSTSKCEQVVPTDRRQNFELTFAEMFPKFRDGDFSVLVLADIHTASVSIHCNAAMLRRLAHSLKPPLPMRSSLTSKSGLMTESSNPNSCKSRLSSASPVVFLLSSLGGGVAGSWACT